MEHITLMKKVAAAVAALLIIGYAAVMGWLYFSQERLIFRAAILPADFTFSFPQRFEEVRIPVPGGAVLHALHFRQPKPRGLVFFLHGNAGNVSTWTTGIDFYRRVNYDLFMLDYRGYGKSTGRIENEEQLRSDVRAAWDKVAPEYAGSPVVIYGRSLGSGLATYLARDANPALLVLVSPYTSLAATANRTYPVAPQWIMKYPLRTDTIIGEVRCPILLVHGTLDSLIPLSDSERLRALARAPVELLEIKGAGHSDIHRFPAYLDGLAARLEQLPGSPVTKEARVEALAH